MNRREWQELVDGNQPITKAQWQAFIREMCPKDPNKRVFLINDVEGWWVHCPVSGDATLDRDCSDDFYRAAMWAQPIHPNATVILAS